MLELSSCNSQINCSVNQNLVPAGESWDKNDWHERKSQSDGRDNVQGIDDWLIGYSLRQIGIDEVPIFKNYGTMEKKL